MNIKHKLRILVLVTVCAMGGMLALTTIAFNRIGESSANAANRQQQIRGLTEIKASANPTREIWM
jgi:hypothetical protein